MNHQPTCRLRADARRETILKAAVRLFSEKGFKGTTTRELSAAVGVSEPVLYEHFRTKQELYEATMQHMLDIAIADLHELMERSAGVSDARTFLNSVAQAIVDWFRREPEFVRLVLYSALEREELSRELYARSRAQIVEALSAALGRMNPAVRQEIDPEIVVHAFNCMIAHHGLLEILFGADPSTAGKAAVEQMVGIFVDGIRK